MTTHRTRLKTPHPVRCCLWTWSFLPPTMWTPGTFLTEVNWDQQSDWAGSCPGLGRTVWPTGNCWPSQQWQDITVLPSNSLLISRTNWQLSTQTGEAETDREIKMSEICWAPTYRLNCSLETCRGGIFTPPDCEDSECSLLLSAHPGIQLTRHWKYSSV